MKLPTITIALTMTVASATVMAQQNRIDASAVAIRDVIVGKRCLGNDVLTFGDSIRGSSGSFERSGRPVGSYKVGYGTILIRRGQDLHGHVTSVSPGEHMLYLSTDTYRCQAALRDSEALSTTGTPAK